MVSPLEYALAYAAIGWHVFPLQPGLKRPMGALARRGHLNATTDEATIRAWWERCPEAGIGVAMQPSRLVTVDVDPRNGGHFDLELLEAEHGRLEADVLAYTGGGGIHMVFTAPTDIGRLPGKLAKGIDLKADGYIAVEPTFAPQADPPHTKPYQWEASSSPLDGAVPSPLPGWIGDLARAPAAVAAGTIGPSTGRALADHELADIRAALAMIPADERETWVTVGMALHKDVGGALGFDLWSAWSQGCPEKFDPQDQQRVWRSFRNRPMGEAVQLGTVFDLAYKHGFSRPRPTLQVIAGGAAGQPDPRTANTVPELVSGPTVAHQSMPVQGLNDLARWVFDACPTGHVLLAQASALALACAAAGRRYVSEFGDPATAYFGIITPSTSQARPTLAAAEQALIRAGMRRLVRSQRLSSAQQVYASFVRSPSVLYAADDWGDQMASAKRQPSGLLSIAHGVLAGRVHGCADVVLDNWAEIGLKRPDAAPKDHMPTLYRPALTLLAAVAEPQLRSMFKRQELGRGAVDCMLFVPALDASAWTDRFAAAPRELPANVRHTLRSMQGEDGTSADELLPTDVVLLHATSTPVPFACNLAGVEQRWIDHARALPAHLRPLSQGARATMRRLCVAMAAFADPERPIVTPEILAWCDRFVHECLQVTLAEVALLSDDDDARPDAGSYLLEMLVRQGPAGMAKRDLHKYCKAYRRLAPEDRQELLGRLYADDEIADVPSQSGRGSLIVARQFVVEKAAVGDWETARSPSRS